jgi:hypothetical protein
VTSESVSEMLTDILLCGGIMQHVNFEWCYLSCCAAPKLLQLSSARFYKFCFVNGKASDLQAWVGPEVSRMLRFPDLMTIDWDMKVVRLSALCIGHLNP